MSAGVSEVSIGPPLTVAVVNWNGRQHLDDCLGSLLRGGYRPLRIVMVDNGSSDDSVAHVRRRYPEVEVIEAGRNLRWAGGNNLVLRRMMAEGSDGELVLLLNNDTIVPPGSLTRLVSGLVAEPRAWAATPRICYAEAPARAWYDGGLVGEWTGWIRHAGIRRSLADLPDEPRFVGYGTGCALLLRREAVVAVGEIDESYYFYGEDTDYCLRLRRAGGEILHLPQAVVLHKVSAGLGADSPRKLYLRTRSHLLLLRRHWPRRRLPVLVPAQALYLGALVLRQLVRARGRAAWAVVQALLDELLRRPAGARG